MPRKEAWPKKIRWGHRTSIPRFNQHDNSVDKGSSLVHSKQQPCNSKGPCRNCRKCRPGWCSSKATKVGSARYTYIWQEFKSQAEACCNLSGNPAHHFQTVFTRAAMIFNIHAVFTTISKHTHVAECQITVVLEWSRMPNYLRPWAPSNLSMTRCHGIQHQFGKGWEYNNDAWQVTHGTRSPHVQAPRKTSTERRHRTWRVTTWDNGQDQTAKTFCVFRHQECQQSSLSVEAC